MNVRQGRFFIPRKKVDAHFVESICLQEEYSNLPIEQVLFVIIERIYEEMRLA